MEETARFFGVTPPTVRGWINNDDCPVVAGGSNGVPYRLDLRMVAAWRRGRQDASEKSAAEAQLRLDLLGDDVLPDHPAVGPLTPRQRLEYLRAEVENVKLAEKRRDLIRADDVRDTLAAAFALFREQMRGLPDQLAERYGWNDDAAETLLGDVDEALNDMADSLTGLAAAAQEDLKENSHGRQSKAA